MEDRARVEVCWADTPSAEPLVRWLAWRLLGQDPGPLHHACPQCGSIEHGRPYVDAPVEISVSHAAGRTVVAVSAAGRVGIDLEPGADAGWMRREAVGKAHGTGITTDHPLEQEGLSIFELDVDGQLAVLAVLSAERPAVQVVPAPRATP